MLDRMTSKPLAKLLGISQQRLAELARESVIPPSEANLYDTAAVVTAYCAHLRAKASGREQPGDVSSQRARLLREQADGHALRNKLAREELVEAAAVAREWSDVLRGVRSAMLAVPSRVRQRLPALTVAEVAEIDAEVRLALNEAAGGV